MLEFVIRATQRPKQDEVDVLVGYKDKLKVEWVGTITLIVESGF